jgi:hypothetical protein
MSQNVYAIYDNNDGQLYQFAALEEVLAKDAVLAFMEENASALFGIGSSPKETKEMAMRQVSETDSVESLISVLGGWDLTFNVIQIK